MSQIRSKDTRPEMLVRKFIFGHGLRYRLHKSGLPGKPDMVFAKSRKIVLIHGCFWHGHKGCKYFVVPKTRTAWWLSKIEGNRSRDKNNLRLLRRQGWDVKVIYECGLRPNKREKTLQRLLEFLSSGANK